jgi:hypothetical protein
LRRWRRQPALLEILDGAGRLLELRTIELSRLERDRGQVERLLAAVSLTGAFDPGDLQAGIAGELLHGVGKALAGVLHQKADRRPVGAASEAVIELLGRTHREGGRLFAVERAAGLVVGARLLEGDVSVDDVDDVDPG